ncbi:hypothetical protein Aduo_006380 [Ancylostoma duodenale]
MPKCPKKFVVHISCRRAVGHTVEKASTRASVSRRRRRNEAVGSLPGRAPATHSKHYHISVAINAQLAGSLSNACAAELAELDEVRKTLLAGTTCLLDFKNDR